MADGLWRRSLWLGGVTALLMATAAPPASAQDRPQEKLQKIERELEEGRGRSATLDKEARQLDADVRELQKDLVETAARAQSQEEVVSGIERQLAALDAEDKARRQALLDRQSAIQKTLGALERIARMPPESLITSPKSAVDAVRTSMLLSAIIPELEAQAEALRAELVALQRLRTEMAVHREELTIATQTLDLERVALNRLIRRKANLREQTIAERRAEEARVAKLASEADDLRALVKRLGKEERAARTQAALKLPRAPGTPSFSAAFGTLSLPARGVISQRFGESNQFGVKSKGLTIETRESAQVISPHDGRIVFAGPFRGYGQLLIIAHGEGYHTLIAGIARIDGTVGQLLLAGEPVGVMRAPPDEKPELYIELRHNGEPIDPLPWLAATKTKVSG
ncbi:MAG: peptidoglycan DD-metalloendopeptidase family protein [Proteobacteria bacterium]|nr:peptidoglycan DD-metalloendopeptidase family protein [Pseudomonadota bacterium]